MSQRQKQQGRAAAEVQQSSSSHVSHFSSQSHIR
uniref:Uncharacterized protein n=1 Tax=Anguilla anguilla TaxID=7936 RepID=A0A0E9RPR4_ANGAN